MLFVIPFATQIQTNQASVASWIGLDEFSELKIVGAADVDDFIADKARNVRDAFGYEGATSCVAGREGRVS